MAEFKEYEDGEVIVRQDQKSGYNLNYFVAELRAMEALKRKDHDYVLSQKLTQHCNYPTLKQAWDEKAISNNFREYLMKKKKDEELAHATGSVKKGRGNLARNTTGTTTRNDDTVSEDCNTNNPMSAGRDIRSTVASPKPLSEQEQQLKDKAASAAARDEQKQKMISKY